MLITWNIIRESIRAVTLVYRSIFHKRKMSENVRNTTETIAANQYQELNVCTSEVKAAVPNTSCPTIFWEYYSSWNKIKRHVAWTVKLITNWLNKKRKELLESKTYLLKMSQEDSYTSELKTLLLNDNARKSSTLVPLSPTFNNQSLICVGSTLKNTYIFANGHVFFACTKILDIFFQKMGF